MKWNKSDAFYCFAMMSVGVFVLRTIHQSISKVSLNRNVSMGIRG